MNIKYDIILGIPWLEDHNLEINWQKRTISFLNYDHFKSEEEISFTKVI
jgi:hypothetical protein